MIWDTYIFLMLFGNDPVSAEIILLEPRSLQPNMQLNNHA